MAEPAAKVTPLSERRTESSAEKPRVDVLSLVIFGLVSLNLAAVGAMGYFLKNLWIQLRDVQQQTELLKVAKAQEPPPGREPKAPEMGVLYPIESFLVNINSDVGPKFLQTQMEFELGDPALENEIARKKPALRDAILLILSSRGYKDLRDPNGMKRLRGDILTSVNSQLTTGRVKNIYFTQFHFN